MNKMRPAFFGLMFALLVFSGHASAAAIDVGAPIGAGANLGPFTIDEDNRTETGEIKIPIASGQPQLMTGTVDVSDSSGAFSDRLVISFSPGTPNDPRTFWDVHVTSDNDLIERPRSPAETGEKYVATNSNITPARTATYLIDSPSEIPEPSPFFLSLFGIGTLGLLNYRRRQRSGKGYADRLTEGGV